MSHDLFAAFDLPRTVVSNEVRPVATSHANNEPKHIWSINESKSLPLEEPENPVEDDFGDFEDASASVLPNEETRPTAASVKRQDGNATLTPALNVGVKPFPPKATPKQSPPKVPIKQKSIGSHPFAGRMDLLFEASDDEYDAGADELGDLSSNPEAAMAYSKRIIAEQQAAQSRKGMSMRSANNGQELQKKVSARDADKVSIGDHVTSKSTMASQRIVPSGPEVLFDADDVSEHESEVDDFGDFESQSDHKTTSVEVTRATQPQKQEALPAIDLLGLDDSSSPAKGINGSFRNNIARDKVSQPLAARTVELDDDDWDDFDTSVVPKQPSFPDTKYEQSSSSPIPTFSSKSASSAMSLPPANIPPPAVLLSLFSSFFSGADDALFNTLGKLDLKQRQMLLGHPASQQFLKGYISHCNVLAHIIAGRKLRWKRDQRLSQSMRIGPAASGGKGGMKLTGLDKSEIAKEDREVLDAVRLWRAQVGKLRNAVSAASSTPDTPKLPAVPDIADQMPVKTLKPADGGITAPHACALCGLKREERVTRVDIEVEDSFGEWWLQGTDMHLACKTFWNDFESKLKSR